MDQKGDSERLQSRWRVRRRTASLITGLFENLRGREYLLLLVEAAEDGT
jgi:hypothetical protein